MRATFGKNTRKLPGQLRTMSAALAIREELMRHLPPLVQKLPESAKVIALKVGITPRAAEGHRQEEQLPSLAVGLAYGRKFPEVRALLVRLMDAETGDSGENPSAVIHEFLKWQRLQGRTL